MTQDEIIEMAKYVGFNEHHAKFDTRFERFAKLVAEKEREACAQVCEDLDAHRQVATWYSKAIRARGEA